MSTIYNHAELTVVGENGETQVIYPQNDASDVSITTTNKNIPESVETVQDLVDSLEGTAFMNSSVINDLSNTVNRLTVLTNGVVIIVPNDKWVLSGSSYKNEIAYEGITGTEQFRCSLYDDGSLTEEKIYAFDLLVSKIITSENKVTLYAYKKPKVSFSIVLVGDLPANNISLGNVGTLIESVSKVSVDIDTANSSIDSFTQLAAGSTTGDAELIDARIKVGGVKSVNDGSAIREQITDLRDKMMVNQEEQPTDAVNKIWITHDENEVEIPTMDEFNEVKEDLSNKTSKLSGEITDIRAYTGMIGTDDILGICMDYKNKTCTRIAGAKNLTAGSDFDKFSMYGGRRRCNVADDGTINAYYGDEGYTEDGSNGQVMVYQPKFYYMVVPLEYDKQESGYGYHLRKANYYVSEVQRNGFKLHPAFYDKNGNEVDYILMSAFEGCIYDTSASAYLVNDEQVADFDNDKFSSIAGVRPASGLTQLLIIDNVEKLAQNRGTDWHSLGIKTVSMEQLLMIIEMGMMNLQTVIGKGVVSISDNSSQSCASFTGSTIGNGTGEAESTKDYAGTVQTASGKKSIYYRGVENFWGNIVKFVHGVNIWGDGKMAGGMPYICSDLNYAESKITDNYEGTGFCMTNVVGYISAMGYSTKYDWLFLASECLGNSSLPVGDTFSVVSNLNGYRLVQFGGRWDHKDRSGGFYFSAYNGVTLRFRDSGGRLVYVPTV